ncbi:hypothetical protein S40285_04700 [Stachybotrys chlorohalonatus IBT 40285]|uniref:Uncharacterized protein n=1 Tax=Stachybotrys chlorohalonatus (strain IBT 40285) TaxID=1283841 RepID=A0A084R313_STAC4|nr:hypothetical protein S40285_04700 [Stachybotrys chlorohalonata IBT 40285]
MADDTLPIALRRTRRSSVGPSLAQEFSAQPVTAKTPRRAKKTVRISDPFPTTASGLTPFIRRTSLGTPGRRRASTPARSCSGSGTSSTAPQPVAFPPLDQTIDGRVQRRLRRSGMRDMLHKIEQDKKRKTQASQSQISRLKAELKARDREIYELQNATVVIDTERIWDLEQQVEDLKDELKRKNFAMEEEGQQTRNYDWTVAARDPFAADEYMDLGDDEFGETTVAQLIHGTPTRNRASASFPTPPATSPTVPSSPFSKHFPPPRPTPQTHAGVQAELPDLEKQQLQEELMSLHLEMSKLTATLNSYKSLTGRVAARLSTDDSSPLPADALEQQVESLLQTMSDRTAALSQLASSIAALGFPGDDAGDMLAALTKGFRAARLELEYLTPGEIALPLSSHGAAVLDLLLTRLRDMARRAKEDEASIDEYHSLEQSLRKQLDARVSVMDGLKAEMGKAEALMQEKNEHIRSLQTGNDRLKGAVDGYVRDIRELEKLVERLEGEGRDAGATLDAHRESHRQALLARDNSVAELEVQLAVAVKRTGALQSEIRSLQGSRAKVNQQHGAALALRDARVMELRLEVDRINTSLRGAHDTICALRVENGSLRGQMEDERAKAAKAIDEMKEELQRALQVGQQFLDTPGAKKPGEEQEPGQGGYLAGELARRRSKKGLARGRDSGLALLDEDEVDF